MLLRALSRPLAYDFAERYRSATPNRRREMKKTRNMGVGCGDWLARFVPPLPERPIMRRAIVLMLIGQGLQVLALLIALVRIIRSLR